MLLKLCKQKRKEKQTLELKMRYKKLCLHASDYAINTVAR